MDYDTLMGIEDVLSKNPLALNSPCRLPITDFLSFANRLLHTPRASGGRV
jgi:hypothetical protein